MLTIKAQGGETINLYDLNAIKYIGTSLILDNVLLYHGKNVDEIFMRIIDYYKKGIPVINLEAC